MSDMIVIGGGPGGYVAAIRAAQLGKDVRVIDDQENLGGICLNWGCIPTKALLHLAEEYEFIQNADRYGITVEDVSIDWEKIIRSSRRAVKKLGKGVESLFKKNGIDHTNDRATLTGPHEVTTSTGETYEADVILLATGAQPKTFPGIEPNGDRIMTSKEAMILKEKPEQLIILGAGAIGMEFAYFYHTFDTEVTVIEMEDRILPQEDPEVSKALETYYERDDMNIMTETAAKEVRQNASNVEVETQDGEVLQGDSALVALGLEPNTDELWADELNLRTDSNGWIDVKDDYRTSIPGVYALGDVIGAPWLAHVASHEGVLMAESAFGEDDIDPLNYRHVPACTYCQPQVASVGLTEPDAQDQYDEVTMGQFPFQANGRSIAVDHREGFVKLVFAGDYDQLVGAHIIGRDATEMISELTIAEELEATPDEIADTIHPHPTRSEAVMEAALDAMDRAIHK